MQNQFAELAPVFWKSMDVSNHFLIQSYTQFEILGYPISINTSQVTTIIVGLFLIAIALVGRNSIIKGSIERPGAIQNITEMAVEAMDKIVFSNMGSKGEGYKNFLLTIMLFVSVSNVSGLFGLRPPTADFAVTLGMGVIAFVIIQYANIKNNGIGAITGLFKPIPILFPINLIGEIANPISLSLRLFGNVVAGTIMLGLYYGLLPWFAKLGFPVVLHAYLDVFSGLIQTYVFVMLIMIWIEDKYEEEIDNG